MAFFDRTRQEQAEAAAAEQELHEQVYQAWLNWQNAQRYFEYVSDPELVDYAIYSLEATRRFYVYMLRKVQEVDERRVLEAASTVPLLTDGRPNSRARIPGAAKG